MVGAIATAVSRSPDKVVRGGSVTISRPLAAEWTVTVVGPHDAAALIARDLREHGLAEQRSFDFLVAHGCATVIAGARSLLLDVDVN